MAASSIKVDAEATKKELQRLIKNVHTVAKESTRKNLERQIRSLRARLRAMMANLRDPTDEAPIKQSLEQKVAETTTFGNRIANELNHSWESDANNIVQRVFAVTDKYGNVNYAHRARYELNSTSSYEEYLGYFKDGLTKTIFAFQQPDGNYKYIQLNDGSPALEKALEDTKIFCSRFRDADIRHDGDGLLQIGKTMGEKKFERDKAKGFTEFTIKSETLKFIEQNGSDVTAIVMGAQSTKGLSKEVQQAAESKQKEQASLSEDGFGPPQPLGPAKPEEMRKALETAKREIDKVELKETKVSSDKTVFTTSVEEPSTTVAASLKGDDSYKILQENLDLIVSTLKQEMAIFGVEIQSIVTNETERAIRDFISKTQKGVA